MKHKVQIIVSMVLVICLSVSITVYAVNETEMSMDVVYTKTDAIEETTAEETEPIPAETEEIPIETETLPVETEEIPVETEPEETEPIPEQGIYEVDIPAEISINEQEKLYITLSYSTLTENQTVYVYIDGDRSFNPFDGYLHLSPTYTDSYEAIVRVGRYWGENTIFGFLTGRGLHKVATFRGPNLQPTEYGIIRFDVLNDTELKNDTYRGTLYFRISFVGK